MKYDIEGLVNKSNCTYLVPDGKGGSKACDYNNKTYATKCGRCKGVLTPPARPSGKNGK